MSSAFLWLIWGWWSFSGLYRLLAEVQLSFFGRFGAISTFAIGAALIGGLTLVACQPMVRSRRRAGLVQPRAPADAKEMAERGMMWIAFSVGAVALVVSLTASAVLVRDGRRDAVSADLDLSSPRPLPADAGRIHLAGYARTELSVEVESKGALGGGNTSTSYMAVVGPDWRPGMRVPVIVQGAAGLPASARARKSGQAMPLDLASAFVRSSTSGFAVDLLGKRGALVDDRTLILDTRQDAERYVLLPVAGLCGLMAALGLAGGLFLWNSLRKANTVSTQGRSSPRPRPRPLLGPSGPPQRFLLKIREVNQGASGGSCVCIFDATVDLDSSDKNVTVTCGAVEPADAPRELADEALTAIRLGAEDALLQATFGASIEVTRLVIQEIDFKPLRFRLSTERELRRLTGKSDSRP